MNRSMKDVEREIEESRARLDRTIDRLQDKLAVSSAVDEMIGGVRHSRYGGMVDQVLASIRNNPVPVLVALAGVGWLLRRVERESREGRRATVDPDLRRPRRAGPYPPSPAARDTGFIADEDIDPDLGRYGAPTYDPARPTTIRTPDPARPAATRAGEV
jgi:hypothetical protein